MAWQDSLLDASFRGFVFDVLNEQYSGGHEVSRHAYPYKDGADVEDMGLQERRFDMTALLWGEDYEQRLQDFIKLLEQRGRGELVHPVYGSMPEVQAIKWEVLHDAERPDAAEIKLSFEQAVPSAPFFDRTLPALLADELDFLSETGLWQGFEILNQAMGFIQTAQGRWNKYSVLARRLLNVFANQIRGTTYGTLHLLDSPRYLMQEIYATFGEHRTIAARAKYSLNEWKRLFNGHRTALAQVDKVARGLVKTSDGQAVFTDRALPQDVVVLAAMSALAAAAVQVQTAADVLQAELKQPKLTPKELTEIANDVRDSVGRSLAACRTVAILTAAEQDTFGSHAVIAAAAATALRLFAFEQGEHNGQTLTPTDIYSRLTAVETGGGITLSARYLMPMAQADDTWRDVAHKILQQAMAVIHLRPPLIRRRVETASCLRQLAFSWYGDHTRADELRRLNPQIVHPNFVEKGDMLNAYAQ